MCEAAHVGHSNCITCIGPLPVGVVEGAIHPVPWLGPPRKSHPTLEPRCTHTHLLLDSHCDRCCSCWVPSWWSYIWFPSVMPAPPTQKEWTKRPNEVPVSSVFVNMLLSHGRPYLSWLPIFGVHFAYALSPGSPLFRNKILRQAIMAPIEQS